MDGQLQIDGMNLEGVWPYAIRANGTLTATFAAYDATGTQVASWIATIPQAWTPIVSTYRTATGLFGSEVMDAAAVVLSVTGSATLSIRYDARKGATLPYGEPTLSSTVQLARLRLGKNALWERRVGLSQSPASLFGQEWSATKEYLPQDIVVYGNVVYVAVSVSVGHAPSGSADAYWTPLSPDCLLLEDGTPLVS